MERTTVLFFLTAEGGYMNSSTLHITYSSNYTYTYVIIIYFSFNPNSNSTSGASTIRIRAYGVEVFC